VTVTGISRRLPNKVGHDRAASAILRVQVCDVWYHMSYENWNASYQRKIAVQGAGAKAGTPELLRETVNSLCAAHELFAGAKKISVVVQVREH